jgi:hypothetical protein
MSDAGVDFKGVPPLPEPVGNSDQGVSDYQALADHSHDFRVGPYTSLTLIPPWAIVAGWQTPSFTVIGNHVFIRGVCGGGAIGIASNIAVLPVGYRPSSQEYFCQLSDGGPFGVIVYPSGTIQAINPPGNVIDTLSGINFSIG